MEAFEAAVASATTLTPGIRPRVYRSRAAAFRQDEFPCAAVMPESIAQTLTQAMPKLQQALLINVDIFVRAAVPDTEADPIAEEVHRLIMADVTLGGLSQNINPMGITFAVDDGDAGLTRLLYEVRFRTEKNDLAVSA